MSEGDFVMSMIEEKWQEHLEMLPIEERFIGLSKILAHMLYKQQQQNIYLQRRLEAECTRKFV